MYCILLCFALCLPTDTAVPLSHAEDGLLRGKNCTGQLNVQRGVVAVVRKECQDFEKLRWLFNILLVLNTFVQTEINPFYMPRHQTSPRAMIVLIFIVVTVISPTVHRSLPTADREFPLMHYTKLISEEHVAAERPLVIVLPIAEEDSTNKEVAYLIEELHTSGRWPIVVYNVGYKMNGNLYTEIHQHGRYSLLISGPCEVREEHISRFLQQLYVLSSGYNARYSWNPRAKFVVSVMSNCTHRANTKLSRAILNELWFYEVMNIAVLSLNSKE